MRTFSCTAPYGTGGLGQILSQFVENARACGELKKYYTTQPKVRDPAGESVNMNLLKFLHYCTPLRFNLGWMSHYNGDFFDRAVANRINSGEIFTGFNGQSLKTFKRANRQGYRRLELISATVHVNCVMRQQNRAFKDYVIEHGWLNYAQLNKTLKEYEMADLIYVISTHAYETFISEGLPSSKLQLCKLMINSRFAPPAKRVSDGIFRIIYAGAISVMKGIPALIEAFNRFNLVPAELILVGGTYTRAMYRYMRECIRRDIRIHIAPGDPLPHLHKASVYVHPSYTDGFGYAPMEAMSCGVPVIVTEDTGMKEHVTEGINGYIVPTGNWKAILERLEYVARNQLSIK